MALPPEPTPQKYRLNAAPGMIPASRRRRRRDYLRLFLAENSLMLTFFRRNIPRLPSAMLGGTRAE